MEACGYAASGRISRNVGRTSAASADTIDVASQDDIARHAVVGIWLGTVDQDIRGYGSRSCGHNRDRSSEPNDSSPHGGQSVVGVTYVVLVMIVATTQYIVTVG